MVTLSVVVRHLHRLELLEASLLCNLILALVGIVLQVAHVGNVTNIAHLVAQSLEVAEHQIECNRGARVSQMGIAIYGRTANVHTYTTFVNWLKHLFATCERIV